MRTYVIEAVVFTTRVSIIISYSDNKPLISRKSIQLYYEMQHCHVRSYAFIPTEIVTWE